MVNTYSLSSDTEISFAELEGAKREERVVQRETGPKTKNDLIIHVGRLLRF